MDAEKLRHYGSRTFFIVAVVLFTVAVVEWGLAAMNVFQPRSYMPGRLVEFAAMFLIPVITVLLRQIRDELRAGKRA
ncbi:MAG: hypothetical protein FIA95_03195 [Gemmatimonadetes bacterium]|nr:hypothetical protein [Gemmatimonadota bacterium]